MDFSSSIWFWFLVALFILSLSICAVSTVYSCCCNRDPDTCCCCCKTNDNEHLLDYERRYLRDDVTAGGNREEQRSPLRPSTPSSRSRSLSAAKLARAKRALPLCRFIKYRCRKTILRRSNKCKNDMCPVCLEAYNDGDAIVLCPCKHGYHLHCLEGWLKVKSICPLCKRSVRSEHSERAPLLNTFT